MLTWSCSLCALMGWWGGIVWVGCSAAALLVLCFMHIIKGTVEIILLMFIKMHCAGRCVPCCKAEVTPGEV